MLPNGPAETLLKRGHNAEHIEKRSVGWDLQVEINETVDQDASAAQQGRQRGCAIDIF